MKRFFKIALLGFFLIGCNDVRDEKIADLREPQDAMLYVQEKNEKQESQETLQALKKDYLEKFFAPFASLSPNPNVQEVFWMQGSLKKYPGYGENLEANSKEYTQKILKDMQLELYPSVSQKAIVIKDTNVRAVPTLRPRFSKPNGYPLDRWQNSSIFYGTPVLITHYDASKRFAHIQTEFVYGWVEVSDLALVSDVQIQMLLGVKDFVMPKTDAINLYDKHKQFLTQGRIGKLFMLDSKGRMFAFKRKSSGELRIEFNPFDLKDFHSFPQSFSQKDVAEYINALMGQKYGWGGMYESRDCSSFIRDIFSNFGLYLPRNSYAQAQYGTHQIRLDDLKLSEKEKVILQNAIPFATIVWLKGHIMLYIGKNKNGEPMMAHSGWSVQSENLWGKREHKLGGVVITTLKPANEFNGIIFGAKTLGDRTRIINNLYPYLHGVN